MKCGAFLFGSVPKIKERLNQISNDAINLRIKDQDFKKFLSDNRELGKFIRYILEYRNNAISAPDEIKARIGNAGAYKDAEKLLPKN